MDAFQIIEALATHIRTETGGWANQKALARLDRLVQELTAATELGVNDRRKLEELRDLAEILYSTRRHRRWERGAEFVRRAMLLNVERVRCHLQTRKRTS
jgi:hypothetical protein